MLDRTFIGRLASVREKTRPFKELVFLVTDGARVDSSVDGKVVVRTLVQLDGDVLTFVTPMSDMTGLTQAVYEQHWRDVELTLKKISKQLKYVVHYVIWSVAFVSFSIISVSTLQDVSLHDRDTNTWLLHALINVVLPVAIGTLGYIGLFRRLLAPLCLRAVRGWAK